jgi:hypothetical protein
MKFLVGAAVVGLLGLLSWFFVLPSMAANSLQGALKTSDVITINNTVDFVSLRENLRGSLGAALSQVNPSADAGSLLGSALSGLFLNPLVDQLVTPAGLVALFQGGMGSLSGQGATNFAVSSGLQGLDRFGIVLTDVSNPKNTITLVLMPRGLSWKLVGITFSPSVSGR